MNLRIWIMWLVALVALLYVNYGIYAKEQLITNGDPVLLELAPVDPRSLIQGDYMDLRYAIATDLEQREDIPRRGQLVITLNANNVAQFERIYAGESLAADERLLNYYYHEWRIDLGAPSYFFQEGTAELYQDADYGELRVDSQGNSVLVGLRDETFQVLGPQK